MDDQTYPLLLHGFDTVECAYYLYQARKSEFDFGQLYQTRESLRQLGARERMPVTLGGVPFLVYPHGTRSGYPFLLTGEDFKVQCGEFNKPSFFVTFRSQALWRESAPLLHRKFLAWAAALGFVPYRREGLSRVDYAFDYHLPMLDFDEDCFVTRMRKDAQYRENKRPRGFTFGEGDIVLRIYDKVAEVEQKSGKVWFFRLWERDQDVWRIEWQVRKDILQAFGIVTFEDLAKVQGDLLRYLCEEQATLRVPQADSNPSRWPLHPWWRDLQGRVRALPHLGVCRLDGKASALAERLFRCAQSVRGYAKAYAATYGVKTGRVQLSFEETFRLLERDIEEMQDPLSWDVEVQKRRAEIECGEW
jgi:hypothetical protein